jgi:hypothetical protein
VELSKLYFLEVIPLNAVITVLKKKEQEFKCDNQDMGVVKMEILNMLDLFTLSYTDISSIIGTDNTT